MGGNRSGFNANVAICRFKIRWVIFNRAYIYTKMPEELRNHFFGFFHFFFVKTPTPSQKARGQC